MNQTLEMRELGTSGLKVTGQGLGCMGMSDAYGTPDDAESIRTFHRAVELGMNFFDTADVYGPHANERLVGECVHTLPKDGPQRKDLVIASKFGLVRDDKGAWIGVCGTPEYCRKSCDASLERMNLDVIDLYYLHRVDPQVPIEETVGAMKELVEAGKVRAIGLSEAGAETIRRAHAVHPIAALQTEYSLWTRDPEPEILPVCRELGICFVAYSPLGRGMLTATISDMSDLPDSDYRKRTPRYESQNFDKNLRLAEMIDNLAKIKGASAAQLAIAWVMAQNDAESNEGASPGFSIVPIPGTKRRKWLEQNVAAGNVRLSRDDLATIDRHFRPGVAAGDRYPAHRAVELNR